MNSVDYKHFYSELGKLLYAVADLDKVITPEEKQELLDMVSKDLVPAELNKDEFGTSTAHYTEFQFEFMDEQIINSRTALQSFLDFIDEHRRLIDENMRRTCLKLAERLMKAYKGIDREEQRLLQLLKDKLIA